MLTMQKYFLKADEFSGENVKNFFFEDQPALFQAKMALAYFRIPENFLFLRVRYFSQRSLAYSCTEV